MVVPLPLTLPSHLTIFCISHCSLMFVLHSVSPCFPHCCSQCLYLGHPWHAFGLVGVFAHFCAVRHDRSATGLVDFNLSVRIYRFDQTNSRRYPDSADASLIKLFRYLAESWALDVCTPKYLNCIICSMSLSSTMSLHLVLLVEMFILSWWLAWKHWKSCFCRSFSDSAIIVASSE